MSNYLEEEVLDLEPVTESRAAGVLQEIQPILRAPSVTALIQTFSRNSLAMVLLDETYSIIWANDAYTQMFGAEQEGVGSSFFTSCRNTLEDEDFGNIYRSLSSNDTKYSWNGRVSCRRTGKRTIIAHVQIIPILGPMGSDSLPAAYTVFMTDITKEYHEMMQATFLSLLEASILKDKDTGRHVKRVNHYSSFVAEILYKKKIVQGIDIDFIEDIGFLASMHDVGKIGTPDDILNKDGKLEPWEWEIMKEHTINGAYILGTYPNPMAREIALFHHERWDGSGYPYGLAGPMIPLSARIVALCDVYDSLRSQRSYKVAFSHEETVELILKERGLHFDPLLVDLFKIFHKRFDRIHEKHQDA